MAHNKVQNDPGFIDLAQVFVRVASTVIWRLITYPIRSIKAQNLKSDVFNAAIRTFLSRVTIPQTRYINPSTTQRYLSFCTSQNHNPSSVSVAYSRQSNDSKEECKATAHWVGDPDADVVILYFHGGAYFQPITSGIFLYMQHFVSTLSRSTGKRVAALVVAYTLAPEAGFPTQIHEGAALLRYLLSLSSPSESPSELSQRRRPESVFLAGDSAGGNIALGLMSHLLHPLPGVEEVELQEPLGGMLLYSPSVTSSTQWNSMQKNKEKDMLPVEKVPVWGALYSGQVASLQVNGEETIVQTSPYLEPCVAGAEWWRDMSRSVKTVLVMSGGDELFADPIRKLEADMRTGLSNDDAHQHDMLFVETPGETHIGPIVSFMTRGGKNGATGSEKVVEEWWKARLAK